MYTPAHSFYGVYFSTQFFFSKLNSDSFSHFFIDFIFQLNFTFPSFSSKIRLQSFFFLHFFHFFKVFPLLFFPNRDTMKLDVQPYAETNLMIQSEEVSLDQLISDEHNANLGSPRGETVLEKSIFEFGFVDAGILDKLFSFTAAHGIIVAGTRAVLLYSPVLELFLALLTCMRRFRRRIICSVFSSALIRAEHLFHSMGNKNLVADGASFVGMD